MTTRALRHFEYLAPGTLEDAISMLAKYKERAKILAGGTDLLVSMKRGEINPECLIYLGGIPGTDYIRYDRKEGLRIGALTTIRAIEKSPIIQQRYPILSEAAYTFGTIQVKNMATIGGNLCNASPAADMALPLLVLSAQVKAVGTDGERIIPIDGFFKGPGQSVLKSSEILLEIQVPPSPAKTGTAFLKIGRTAEDLAKVGVAVSLAVEDDVCHDVKISLGAVAPTPLRAKKAEEMLKGKKLDAELVERAAEVAADEIMPITDLRSTSDYRREVSKVLVRRALGKAMERLK